MNFSANSKKSAAQIERQQQRLDAGFIEAHYPEVAGITVSMTYNQRGIQKPLSRIVNFFPESFAIFRIDCLHKTCTDGGFDLTQVITTMIRDRRNAATGNLMCKGTGPTAEHSAIAYEVAIQYT